MTRSAVLAVLASLAPWQAPPRPEPAPAVVVASKPFGESYVLAEMFARLLESRGVAVDRRLGLGATEIAFGALRAGAIDVYPEYTGTGLVAILGETPAGGPHDVFARVSRAFRERWGVRWLPPLGFENTYAIAVRRRTADSLGLRTLSDLAPVAPRLIGGFTPDFIGRDDGLPGLRRAYDLDFRDVRSLLQAVKYEALATGSVDVIDGYSTDGFIARYDLVVLEDDRGFFPPYDAAALVGRRLAEERPDVVAALSELSGRLDAVHMRDLNRRVELDGEAVAAVAERALRELGLLGAPGAAAQSAPRVAGRGTLGRYLWDRRSNLLALTLRHLLLVGVSLIAGIAVAIPLGLALERTPRAAEPAVRSIGLLQVVPGIALLAFMIPLPDFLYRGVSAQSQLISSGLGVGIIKLFGISVLLDGNVIDLGTYKLQVAEACNGLRYLFPLMTLGFIAAYFFEGAWWKRAIVFLSTIRITILMNSFRIGVIGVMVEYWGRSMAEGFLHDFEGWVIFMACTAVLVGEMWLLANVGSGKRSLRDVFAIALPPRAAAQAPIRPRSVPRPFVGALFLLLVSTVLVVTLPSRVESPLQRKDLSQFPMTVGKWQGKASRMEAIYMDVLKVDDYVLADYIAADRRPVNFYVAYYASQRKGESAHSPRSCIPGDGWEITDLTQRTIAGASAAG